jgi:hypothetical protein
MEKVVYENSAVVADTQTHVTSAMRPKRCAGITSAHLPHRQKR